MTPSSTRWSSRPVRRILWAMGIAAVVTGLAVFVFEGAEPGARGRAGALVELWILNFLVWSVILWLFDSLRARSKS